MRSRKIGRVLTMAMLVAIGIATLTPAPDNVVTTSLWCIACGDLGALDVAANIIMFMPLGFALALATERRWWPVLLCFAATLIVETLQIRVVVGRDASLSDLLANTLGGWVGCEIGLRWRTFLRPATIPAARLAVAGAAGFALIGLLTSLGLRPAEVPRSLWIQWVPPRASFTTFTGRVLKFDINGIDLPLGYPKVALGLTRVLSNEPWLGTVAVSRDGIQPARSVIVRVAEEFTVLVSVEQHGWDLTCQEKTRSADFRFRSPRIALAGALRPTGDQSSSTARLTCGRADAKLTVGVAESGGPRSEVVALSPSLGWILVSPFDIPVSSRVEWVGALWLFSLVFPVGYWSGMVGGAGTGSRRRRWVVTAVVLASLVFGLAASPMIAGTAQAAAWEWASALGGLVAGVISALAVARRSL